MTSTSLPIDQINITEKNTIFHSFSLFSGEFQKESKITRHLFFIGHFLQKTGILSRGVYVKSSSNVSNI